MALHQDPSELEKLITHDNEGCPIPSRRGRAGSGHVPISDIEQGHPAGEAKLSTPPRSGLIDGEDGVLSAGRDQEDGDSERSESDKFDVNSRTLPSRKGRLAPRESLPRSFGLTLGRHRLGGASAAGGMPAMTEPVPVHGAEPDAHSPAVNDHDNEPISAGSNRMHLTEARSRGSRRPSARMASPNRAAQANPAFTQSQSHHIGQAASPPAAQQNGAATFTEDGLRAQNTVNGANLVLTQSVLGRLASGDRVTMAATRVRGATAATMPVNGAAGQSAVYDDTGASMRANSDGFWLVDAFDAEEHAFGFSGLDDEEVHEALASGAFW